jgi:hypothetical protein
VSLNRVQRDFGQPENLLTRAPFKQLSQEDCSIDAYLVAGQTICSAVPRNCTVSHLYSYKVSFSRSTELTLLPQLLLLPAMQQQQQPAVLVACSTEANTTAWCAVGYKTSARRVYSISECMSSPSPTYLSAGMSALAHSLCSTRPTAAAATASASLDMTTSSLHRMARTPCTSGPGTRYVASGLV